MRYEVYLAVTIYTAYAVEAESPEDAQDLAKKRAEDEYERVSNVRVDSIQDTDGNKFRCK